MERLKNKRLWIMFSLLVFSVVMFLLSLQLPLRGHHMVSPAAVTIVFTCLLAILSVFGIVGALTSPQPEDKIKSGFFKRAITAIKEHKSEDFTMVLSVLMNAAYLFVLLPLLHFYIATPIYVFSSVCIFSPKTKKYWGVVTAAATMLLLYVVFIKMFNINIKL